MSRSQLSQKPRGQDVIVNLNCHDKTRKISAIFSDGGSQLQHQVVEGRGRRKEAASDKLHFRVLKKAG
jgi:hypothetical protein